MQKGILADCLASVKSGAYIQQLQATLAEPLDRERFIFAWGQLTAQQPALRTVFDTGGDVPAQKICDSIAPDIEFVDWQGIPQTSLDGLLDGFLKADRRRGFDLSRPPLFRVTVFLLGDQRFQFVWTSHHLLFDGRSRYRLLLDFFDLYSGHRGPGHFDPTRSYGHFVHRCRDYDADAAMRFWRGAWPLDADNASLIEQFTSCVSHRKPGHGVLKHRLQRHLTRSISGLSRQPALGQSTLFHAAWACLSHRYTGSEWTVFGVTRSCRGPEADDDDIVGMCVNTVPLAVRIDPDDTAASLLQRTRQCWRALNAHETNSVVDIGRWRGCRQGLFDVILNFESYELNDRLRTLGPEWENRKFRLHGITNLPLVLSIYAGERYELELVYDHSVLDDVMAGAILEQYVTVLSGLAQSGTEQISDIRLVSDKSFEKLTTIAGQIDDPVKKSVVECFQDVVRSSPDSIALNHGRGAVTYTGLDQISDRVAAALAGQGVSPGMRVGVLQHRGFDMVATLLGILKAGAVYVPVDPGFPIERTRFILRDAGIQVMVTSREHEESARALDVTALVAESLQDTKEPMRQLTLPSPDPSAPAYVMYTSGSTGEPKGTVVPHRGIVRLVRETDYLPFGPDRVFCLHSSMVFDASTFELWGALLNGSRCVVLESDDTELGALGDAIDSHGVDCLWLTSSLFNLIVDECIGILRGVGYLLVGGEELSVPHVVRALDLLPGTQLINGYGPTENTTFTCTWRIPRNLDSEIRHIPIGSPIKNTYVYILDHAGQPVPVGCPGELVIGGEGLALGYLNRAGMTSGKFVEDPYRTRNDARVYLSGDRCRWLDSGEIEFLGRTDDQHKVRGFRVEPGETTAILTSHPSVSAAITMVVTRHDNDKQLESWVVPAAPAAVSARELRSFLAGRLPYFNVPWRVNVIDRLPLTNSGKIDRDKLISSPPTETQSVNPAPALLIDELCQMRNDVLGIDGAGPVADFFELGGDSLSGMRFLRRVEDKFDTRLSFAEFLGKPTIDSVANMLQAADAGITARKVTGPVPEEPGKASTPGNGFTRDDSNRNERLTFAQSRLWFLDQLEPGSDAYLVRRVWRISGRLNTGALGAALRHLVERHQILRLCVREQDGEPYQAQLPLFDPLTVMETTTDDPDAAIRRLQHELTRPMALDRGPLFRAVLVKVGEEDHQLGVVMHHIVTDAWSLNILWRELSDLYSGIDRGVRVDLDPLPTDFRGFVDWQRRATAQSSMQDQLAYWKRKLSGFEALDLPIERTRPAAPDHRGRRYTFYLDEVVTRKLDALARNSGATLYMVFLAALKCLLGRYCGQTDIVVGSVISNRPHARFETIVGFLTNTLVLRSHIDTTRAFSALLSEVRSTCLEAYANQDFPFEKLVEELKPPRGAGRHPFFDVMFVMNNIAPESLRLGSTEATLADLPTQNTKFDLTVTVNNTPGRFEICLDYRTALFDENKIRQIGRHYGRILESVAETPHLPAIALPMLSEAECKLQLHDWTQTRFDIPEGATIHGLFESCARDFSSRIALQSGSEQLTYRALDIRANQFARYLMQVGVTPGSHVGLLLERSMDCVVAVLGILKSGSAFVPMDIDWPDSRLAYMMENSTISYTVTRGRYTRNRSTLPCEYVLLDELNSGSVDLDEAALDLEVDWRGLAYILYTSGSTGQPKGVQAEHRSVVNYALSALRRMNLSGMTSYALVQPLTADSSGTSLYCALLSGATLHVMSVEESLDGVWLGNYLDEFDIDVLKILPSHFEALQSPDRISVMPRKRLVFGGEMARPGLAKDILTAFPETHVYNHYGPTETTIAVSSCRLMLHDLEREQRYLPVGQPFGNCRTYVLDDRMQPVPLGVRGEVYVGGICLARGYQGRSDLTARSFVDDPHGEPGERLYRTGDIGTLESDGKLRIVGRADNQIKILGYRVEPGEVNGALGECPGVDESVVVLIETRKGRGELAAIYVSKSGLAPHALEKHARALLPEFMVPRRFVRKERIPRLAMGKADLVSLKELFRHEPATVEENHPTHDLEHRVMTIWRDILGLDNLRRDDNFFEVGGHSLLAAQLISRLSHELDRQVPLRYLFDQPSVAGLSDRLLSKDGGTPKDEVVKVRTQSRTKRVPLSYAQQRIWFMNQFDGGSHFYNMHRTWRIRGKVNTRALESAFVEIVNRHEALRTIFIESDGALHQSVRPPGKFQLNLFNTNDNGNDLALQMRREIEKPIDLTRDLLIRPALFTCPDGSHVLLIIVHHIASDAWSMSVLSDELGRLYNAIVGRRLPDLLPLPLQYADYSLWQRSWLEESEMQRQLDYWRTRLDGLERPELPLDHPRRQTPSYSGGRGMVRLSAETTDALRRLASDNDATLFMVLLCAFKILLYRYSGHGDITVGTPIANRHHREVESLIGFFSNTLIFRDRLAGRESFSELLGRIRQTCLEAYEHQDLPFDRLVEEIQPDRDPGRHPLFDALILMHNVPDEVLDLKDLEVDRMDFHVGVANFDLLFLPIERNDRLELVFSYRKQLFEHGTITRMIGHMQRILMHAARDPSIVISTLPISSPEENQKLLTEFSGPSVAIRRDRSILTLLETTADTFSAAPALACGRVSVSYRELDQSANRLANHLIRGGLEPGDRVGVMLERGFDSIVALLATLKAGGAYVPLDIHSPQDRLSLMADIASAGVLITDSENVQNRIQADRIVDLAAERGTIEQQSASNPAVRVDPDSAAYIMFTSGSTGTPKACVNIHSALLNLIGWQSADRRLSTRARTLQYCSLSFDVSLQEILGCLTTGGTLVIVDEQIRRDPLLLARHIADNSVERLFITSVALNDLLECIPKSTTGDTLRDIVSTGDQLRISPAVREYFLRNSECRLHNHYGPVETHVGTAVTLDNDPAGWPDLPPIGKPINNNRIFVIDSDMQLAPISAPGEICIAGPGVAGGYLNDDPAALSPFTMLSLENEDIPVYRTGDFGRYLIDGNIEFLGRSSDQVKIRGYRVAPAEIESTLVRHGAVRNAAVLVFRDGPADTPYLAAYVVADRETDITQLRTYLSGLLPEYMIPAAIVQVDALPNNSRGKVDRNALPKPDIRSGNRSATPPRSDIESRLLDLWVDVLPLEHAGIHDSFFDLGGHSLLAATLMMRLNHEFKVSMTTAALFYSPSVALLARAIEKHRHDEAAADAMASAATFPVAPVRTEDGPSEPGGSADTTPEFFDRPLEVLILNGELARVDAASIGYVPEQVLARSGGDRGAATDVWCQSKTVVRAITSSVMGRIAAIAIPMVQAELYENPGGLVTELVKAHDLAESVGAGAISLTGVLPSTTDYGLALTRALSDKGSTLKVTTGHDITSSSIVLSIERMLALCGRSGEVESVGFLGLGAIGQRALRLMLHVLPHPRKLLLCDLYSRVSSLERLADEILELGYRGELRVAPTRNAIPQEFYTCSLIVGATNVPDVLDISRLRPGTLIVDDSAPHCFDVRSVYRRLKRDHDVLYTEGGLLEAPFAFERIAYTNPESNPETRQSIQSMFTKSNRNIGGCVMSSLLVQRYHGYEPAIGDIDVAQCIRGFDLLSRLGFTAAEPHCNPHRVPPHLITKFIERYGTFTGQTAYEFDRPV